MAFLRAVIQSNRTITMSLAALAALACVVGPNGLCTYGRSVVRAQETQEVSSTSEKYVVERPTAVEIPRVLLTDRHKKLCRVEVGDEMPAIELPKLSGGNAKLSELYGKQATVVVFWNSNRRMAREELAEIRSNVIDPFTGAGVKVVGIAVSEPTPKVRTAVSRAKVDWPTLIDSDGAAFAKVGKLKLPRTYVLDASGKIVWFDIEYSQATRREMVQVLEVLTSN